MSVAVGSLTKNAACHVTESPRSLFVASMKPLAAHDAARILAAEGWLQLGNFLEANAELDAIAPLFRAHPDVLEVRYNVFAAAKKGWLPCDC